MNIKITPYRNTKADLKSSMIIEKIANESAILKAMLIDLDYIQQFINTYQMKYGIKINIDMNKETIMSEYIKKTYTK